MVLKLQHRTVILGEESAEVLGSVSVILGLLYVIIHPYVARFVSASTVLKLNILSQQEPDLLTFLLSY